MFLNDSKEKTLTTHALITPRVARALVKARKLSWFTSYEDVKRRVKHIDNALMEALREDESITLNCGALIVVVCSVKIETLGAFVWTIYTEYSVHPMSTGNTAVFKLVQLGGVASTMYTCMVLLDP